MKSRFTTLGIARISVTAALSALAVASTANAQTPAIYPSYYIGFKTGGSKADFGPVAGVFRSTLGSATSQKDDAGRFSGLFGGVRVNENLGFELSLLGANKLGYTDRSGVGAVQAKTIASATVFDVVAYLPLAPDWQLYGKLGVAATNTRAEAQLSGAALLASGENKTHDAGRTAAHFGLGVSHRVAKSVDLRLEFDRISKFGATTGSNATGSSGLSAVSLGIAYHF